MPSRAILVEELNATPDQVESLSAQNMTVISFDEGVYDLELRGVKYSDYRVLVALHSRKRSFDLLVRGFVELRAVYSHEFRVSRTSALKDNTGRSKWVDVRVTVSVRPLRGLTS